MTELDWSELFQACVDYHAVEMLIAADIPPAVRRVDGWRSLSTSLVQISDLNRLASHYIEFYGNEKDAFQQRVMSWRENISFRITAFGFPETRLIVVERLQR